LAKGEHNKPFIETSKEVGKQRKTRRKIGKATDTDDYKFSPFIINLALLMPAFKSL
jgi:hypothetical protein